MKQRIRRTYENVNPGKWERYFFTEQVIQCCDCGLVHRYNFRVRNGKLEAKVVRDNRATGQIRRHAGIEIQKRKP